MVYRLKNRPDRRYKSVNPQWRDERKVIHDIHTEDACLYLKAMQKIAMRMLAWQKVVLNLLDCPIPVLITNCNFVDDAPKYAI